MSARGEHPGALPAELSGFVERIAKRTKLWRRERAEVSRELTAHFADGLESGASAEELIEAFGEPKAAAKLIRRAKKRNRPLWWRTMAGTARAAALAAGGALALLFVAYAALFVIYYTGEPTIKRNYVAELNAEIDAIPKSERAWPVYLEAIRLLRDDTDWQRQNWVWAVAPTRDEAFEWVEARREGVEAIRDAASKPVMGYRFSARPDPQLRIAHGDEPDESEAIAEDDPANPVLIDVLLPYLGDVKRMTRMLWVDAHAAMASGDAERFERDVTAMFGVADQCRAGAFLIVDLVSVSIVDLAMQTMRESLVEAPDLLDEAAWRRLAHRMGSFPRDGEPIIRLSGERMLFDDFLQRFFTDDGDGGGVPTHAGMKLWGSVSGGSAASMESSVGDRVLGPISVATFGNRRELKAEYDRLLALALSESAAPLWEQGAGRLDAELEALNDDLVSRQRYAIIYALMPAVDRALRNAELLEMAREGTAAAIACELHRRRTGAWPTSWDELVPDLLPSTPIDRFTGEPMGLRVVDGQLRIYGVGADYDDDGGEWARDGQDRIVNNRAREWRPRGAPAEGRQITVNGDWVLFPTEPIPEETPEP